MAWINAIAYYLAGTIVAFALFGIDSAYSLFGLLGIVIVAVAVIIGSGIMERVIELFTCYSQINYYYNGLLFQKCVH